LRPGITESQLLAELAAHNEHRKALCTSNRPETYQVVDLKGNVHAEEVGRMEFFVARQKGLYSHLRVWVGISPDMALNPLINSEIEAAAAKSIMTAPFPPTTILESFWRTAARSVPTVSSRKLYRQAERQVFVLKVESGLM